MPFNKRITNVNSMAHTKIIVVSEDKLHAYFDQYNRLQEERMREIRGVLHELKTEHKIPNQPYLSRKELAQRWGVSLSTVDRLTTDKKIKATTIKGSLRFNLKDIENYERATV